MSWKSTCCWWLLELADKDAEAVFGAPPDAEPKSLIIILDDRDDRLTPSAIWRQYTELRQFTDYIYHYI